jgi:hypothetical protein
MKSKALTLLAMAALGALVLPIGLGSIITINSLTWAPSGDHRATPLMLGCRAGDS